MQALDEAETHLLVEASQGLENKPLKRSYIYIYLH